jgi:hypothetical protein
LLAVKDADDDRKTIAVPRLQRERRDDVLPRSGRLMPLREEAKRLERPSVEMMARGSQVGMAPVAIDIEDIYEGLMVIPAPVPHVMVAPPAPAAAKRPSRAPVWGLAVVVAGAAAWAAYAITLAL